MLQIRKIEATQSPDLVFGVIITYSGVLNALVTKSEILTIIPMGKSEICSRSPFYGR